MRSISAIFREQVYQGVHNLIKGKKKNLRLWADIGYSRIALCALIWYLRFYVDIQKNDAALESWQDNRLRGWKRGYNAEIWLCNWPPAITVLFLCECMVAFAIYGSC